jgi:NADPH2:quinone reductase
VRAALYRKEGPAKDVLSVEELESPDPGPGEVRVRLGVSGVNPTDVKQRAGEDAVDGFPFVVPHQDGAGVIDAVGIGVDEARVGERVWVYFAAWQRQYGTAAEMVALPADQAVPLPDGASLDLGASLGIPALTAHCGLTADGPLEGRSVLVAGGAGAVGHFGIQLAKHLGARVITTVSTEEKGQLAKEAGADEVVNYKRQDTAEAVKAFAPHGVDRILEVALGANADLDAEVVAPHGAVTSYMSSPLERLEPRPFMTKNVVLRFLLVYSVPPPVLEAAVHGVQEAVAAGALSELPVHRYDLDEVVAAHQAVESGATGKVVVDLP